MKLPADNSLVATRQAFINGLTPVYGESEALALFYRFAEDIFDWKRADLLDKNKRLSESELLKFHQGLKELITAKPLQYVVGFAFFYGLKLRVNSNVLIPRPETEELVHWLLEECILKRGTDFSLLDFCTGSGCIPISIAKKYPMARITAVDIDSDVLELAEKNAKEHNTHIDFIKADVLTNEFDTFPSNSLDYITANPPYVLESEKASLHQNVIAFEPHLALFVSDDDALIFYRKIIECARRLLKKNGILLMEIHEQKGQAILELLRAHAFSNCRIHQDLQGKDRFISAEAAI